jgi:hypothetical protein
LVRFGQIGSRRQVRASSPSEAVRPRPRLVAIRAAGGITEIIGAMRQRAAREKYTQEKLKNLYRTVFAVKVVPKAMRPETAKAWARLFGFGEVPHHYGIYTDKSSKAHRGKARNPITKRQLDCIGAILKELKICQDTPQFDPGLSPSWLSFLDHILAATKGHHIGIARERANGPVPLNSDDDSSHLSALPPKHALIVDYSSEKAAINDVAVFIFWIVPRNEEEDNQLIKFWMSPIKYSCIAELLDDMFIHYLYPHVEPFTYGIDWMIFGEPMNMRILAPLEWLFDRKQSVDMTSGSWLASLPVAGAIDTGTRCWIKPISRQNRNLEGQTRLNPVALCCRTQALMKLFRKHPKAPNILLRDGILELRMLDRNEIEKFPHMEIRNHVANIGDNNAIVEAHALDIRTIRSRYAGLFEEADLLSRLSRDP